jgi:hypothetical protein
MEQEIEHDFAKQHASICLEAIIFCDNREGINSLNIHQYPDNATSIGYKLSKL